MKRFLAVAALFCISLSLTIAASALEIAPKEPYRSDDMLINSDPDILAVAGNRPIIGTQNVLLVVGHWSGQPGLDPDKIREQTFSNHWDSLRSYVLAASGNKVSLEGKQIEADFGPAPETCTASGSLAAARAAALQQNIDPTAYQYLFVAVPCGGGAIALTPGNWVWVKGQPGSPHVWKHEWGHNLGYFHGGTYTRCPIFNGIVQAPDQCTLMNYGDTGDSVSGGGTLYPANNRWFSGWLDDSQAAVINNTGLYRLGVLGGEGPQLYLINRPTAPNQIALEYRQPTPFDNFAPDDNRVTGVWIRYTSMNGSVRNVQLDATPETSTTADPTLQPGRILEDTTANIRVKVCTADKMGATIAISLNGQALPLCTTTIQPPFVITPEPNTETTLRPLITGTARAGAVISVADAVKPDNPFSIVTADAQGKWSTKPPENLSPGQNSIVTVQHFGNEISAPSAARTFRVVEVVDVPFPAIETPVEGSETGPNPLLSGKALPGAHIRVTKAYAQYHVLVETDADAYGNWAARSSRTLPPGAFSLGAWQSIDGKRSPWSPHRNIIVTDNP